MARRLPRSSVRRAAYAVLLVLVVEIVGTLGFHALEGMGWVNAFYFESMLATGQGPPLTLTTDAGKVFASFMGFVSVGSVLSAIVFTLGPIFVHYWREGIEAAETEARRLEAEAARGVRHLEEELTGRRGGKAP